MRPCAPLGERTKLRQEIQRVLRFGTVGAVGFVVNSTLLWLLVDRASMYYVLASVMATGVAILCNFLLNNIWTFNMRSDATSMVGRFMRFNVVSIGGLILTVAILFILRQFLGLHYLVANVIAVGSASMWNYLINRNWTWQVTPAVNQ